MKIQTLKDKLSIIPFEEIRKVLHKDTRRILVQEKAVDLVPTLQSVPELKVFDGKMRAFANGWSSLDYFNLACSLIFRSMEVGVDLTILDLKKYLEEDDFFVKQMYFLGGVTIQQEVQFGRDISLLPFFPLDNAHRCSVPGSDDENPQITNQIHAVLVKKYKHPKKHVENTGQSLKPVMPELWDFKDLEHALFCISLLGMHAPIMLATAILPVRWVPAFDNPVGQHPYGEKIKNVREVGLSDIERLENIYNKFTSLDPKTKKWMYLSLRRLNMAKCRQFDVDTAIDIGIILEILFGEGKALDASIGFTLRIRASRLLRKNLEDRLKMEKFIKSLYSLRSKAAHSGELPEKFEGVSVQQILEDGLALVIEALIYFIENGKPDWNEVIYS